APPPLLPPRDPPPARGDDVALPLRRPRRDRPASRVEEEMRPAAVVHRVRRPLLELTVRTEERQRRIRLALVHLAPEELLDRAFGTRDLAAQRLRQGAVRRGGDRGGV